MPRRQQGTRRCPSISRRSEMLPWAPQVPWHSLSWPKKIIALFSWEAQQAGMGVGISRQLERIKG